MMTLEDEAVFHGEFVPVGPVGPDFFRQVLDGVWPAVDDGASQRDETLVLPGLFPDGVKALLGEPDSVDPGVHSRSMVESFSLLGSLDRVSARAISLPGLY